MDQLLTLLAAEDARELQFRAGSPPRVLSQDGQRPLQGPPMTDDDVILLLRRLASSRQMWELRLRGTVQFIYAPRGRTPFLVRARLEDEQVVFGVS